MSALTATNSTKPKKTGGPARHAYSGPAVLAMGFRPFFLLAGLWAAVSLPLWLALLVAGQALPSRFDPFVWHGHEMLFGYTLAVIVGFLLTAIPNWTGRLPLRGRSLGALAVLWILGRLAVAFSEPLGALPAAVIDLAFLLVFTGAVAREIFSGRNWRNLPIAAVASLLCLANLLVHLQALGWAETADLGLRLGLAAVTMLIVLIGGRIIPSFTGNWLKKQGISQLPAAFGALDRVAVLICLSALVAWTLWPEAQARGALLLLAGLASGLRLARWQGLRSLREPLVWVLHLGHLWLAAGFVLLGLSGLFAALPGNAALHGLTSGAIGTMTLAMMTRASLGHSGRPLTAGRGTSAIYLLVSLAALARVTAPYFEAQAMTVIGLAAACWTAAFALFVALYGPLLTRSNTNSQ